METLVDDEDNTAAQKLWMMIALGLTIMFALTQHPAVDKLFKQAKSKGMTDKIFKFVLAGCWGAFWAFLFFGMTAYAAGVPDNLGYFGDAIQLEGSYGMMRFSFLLVSIFGSMLVAQLFELWTTENVVEALPRAVKPNDEYSSRFIHWNWIESDPDVPK